MSKIVKGGTLWAFWKSSLLQNIKKIEGGPFGDKKIEKVSAPQKLKGGPFSLILFFRLR